MRTACLHHVPVKPQALAVQSYSWTYWIFHYPMGGKSLFSSKTVENKLLPLMWPLVSFPSWVVVHCIQFDGYACRTSSTTNWTLRTFCNAISWCSISQLCKICCERLLGLSIRRSAQLGPLNCRPTTHRVGGYRKLAKSPSLMFNRQPSQSEGGRQHTSIHVDKRCPDSSS